MVTYLRNLIAQVAHTDLQKAKEYYRTTVANVDSADSLEELCEMLNHADVYGCGSNFEITYLEN